MVIPVDVGALGTIADRLLGWLFQLPETISEVELQKSTLPGTAQVLRRVLRFPGLWQRPESKNNTTHGRMQKNFFSTTTVTVSLCIYIMYEANDDE